MARKARDPFEVRLEPEAERTFAHWLCDEITHAESARSSLIGEGGLIDYYHWLYEQGRRLSRDLPWPGAADLNSYLVFEKLSALRARLVKTIFTEPVWTVEGWGVSASKAPLVEEFHQWKVEDERLQSVLSRWIHLALIEGTGVLEVYEKVEKRKVQEARTLAIQTVEGEDGMRRALLDPRGRVMPEVDDHGEFVEPADPDQPQADILVERIAPVRKGPSYSLISLRDFLLLPGHARCDDDLWGYAKRFTLRMPELLAREQQGVYRHVDAVGTEQELMDARTTHDGQQVAPQLGRTAEKVLWEVLLLHDLDEDGLEEWYVATVHPDSRTLLRLQRHDLNLPRYVLGRPIPHPTSVYGYSFVQSMASLAEEHASVRNMIADRSTMVTNAPVKRVQGALWDPQEQPWGPRQVIDVRDHHEIEPVSVPDVPQSMIYREQGIISAAERMSGLNDVATGAGTEEARTLGEVQMVTEQSFVRMEESLRNLQEALEDLWKLRHELWKRALHSDPAGLEVTDAFKQSLGFRGVNLDENRITAESLEGTFRGKPHGSVETADTHKMRSDFNQFMQTLGGFAQMFPPLQQLIANPRTMQSLMEHALRLFRVTDKQVFLDPLKQMAEQQALQPPMPPGLDPSMLTGPGGPAPGMMGGPMMPPPGPPPGPPTAPVGGGGPGGASPVPPELSHIPPQVLDALVRMGGPAEME
jgi:hypothetical protein